MGQKLRKQLQEDPDVKFMQKCHPDCVLYLAKWIKNYKFDPSLKEIETKKKVQACLMEEEECV